MNCPVECLLTISQHYAGLDICQAGEYCDTGSYVGISLDYIIMLNTVENIFYI